MIHRAALPISPSVLRNDSRLEVVIYVAWVIWCSSKNCHQGPTLINTDYSFKYDGWRPSLRKSKDVESRS